MESQRAASTLRKLDHIGRSIRHASVGFRTSLQRMVSPRAVATLQKPIFSGIEMLFRFCATSERRDASCVSPESNLDERSDVA
jgi:hypothetical protein